MHEIGKFNFDKDTPYERETAKRFSFSDSTVSRRDLLRGTDKKSERYLEYPSPSQLYLKIRSNLVSKHDILGTQNTNSDVNIDSFKIPYGAKPILYGAISRTSGDFSYGDGDLFYDLGVLLNHYDNSVADTASKIIFRGIIGANVALVDFTSQHEKGLFLVPGSELYAHNVPDESDNLSYYLQELEAEFSNRFMNPGIRQEFVNGYNLIKK